jgi:hypothetical protein
MKKEWDRTRLKKAGTERVRGDTIAHTALVIVPK